MYTAEDLLKRRSALSPEKRLLLQRKLRGETVPPAPNAIPLRPADGPAPLSAAQQRFWFLQQLEPGSSHFNEHDALRMSGSLDVAALTRAVREIVRRHAVLRSRFQVVDGQLSQAVDPRVHLDLPVPLVDLQGLPKGACEAEARRLAGVEARQLFDLTRPPLVRVTLLRLGSDEHVLLLTMHHIVTDGWSFGLFVQELATLYAAFCAGHPSPLPEPPIQYADFAAWQHERLQRGAIESQLAFWRRQLAGPLPVLELPGDRPRPAIQDYRGAAEALALPPSLTGGLRALSQQEGVTLFMTLLAAFQTLLGRYTGQDDILVGSPIAGRNQAQLEELIGCFLNTLVLRADLAGNPTFRELLQRVRETCLAAYAHQDLPFEKLIEALQPERDASRSPLFQTMFQLQNYRRPSFSHGAVSVRPFDAAGRSANVAAQCDLALVMEESEQGLAGSLVYDATLFDAGTIARLLAHFRTLLEGVVADPDRRLSDLPLLTHDERQRMLVDWNATATELVDGLSFCRAFEAQVAHTPDAVATVADGEEVSYGELNARANRLARSLVELGVGRDVVVTLVAERGIALLTAIVAIFKAGGAYLPLDPHQPAQRLRQVIEQSRSPLVIATHALTPRVTEALAGIPHDILPRVACVDDLLALPLPEENMPALGAPGDLAYVIYTSGSTGIPKGAMVEQRGMLNHLQAKIVDLKLTAGDRVAQTASQCFDISVWQLLAPLLAGGCVHVISDDVAHDPAALLEQVDCRAISVLETVPSLLRTMLDRLSALPAAARPGLRALRWLIPTGEALAADLCRRWLKAYPDVPLLNAYGPTECSDDVTHYPICEPPAAGVTRIPIGRPIANMRLYVLDRYLQPVPIGVAGELYAGGSGVGRGYLNDAARTAAAFVADPFAPAPGLRLYKTGDLVRWLADGTLDFLGRADHQVKIRGFRIELGEVEVLLSQHPGVAEVAVVAREDVPGDPRLVAYVVARHAPGLTVSELRSWLGVRVPEYMLPAAIVMLAELPLTPNGKLDRRALPMPDQAQSEPVAAFVAPRTPVEEELARIWSEVLGMERIGVNDSFFDLGGHSLLAARLVYRMSDALKIDVPLRSLFARPTIAGLGLLIEETLREQVPQRSGVQPRRRGRSPLVELQPAGSRTPIFCVHPIGGTVICYYELARLLGADRPFYALEAAGIEGDASGQATIEAMATTYLEEVKAVQPAGPYLLGGWSLGGVVAFEMAQQLRRQGEPIHKLLMFDSRVPQAQLGRDADDAIVQLRFVEDLARMQGTAPDLLYARLRQHAPDAQLRHALAAISGAELSRQDSAADHMPRILAQLHDAGILRGRDPEEQLEYLLDQLGAAGILPSDLTRGRMRRLYEVYRGNFRALRSYTPRSSSVSIVLFRPEEQTPIHAGDASLGWRAVTSGLVDVFAVPGTHDSMLARPHVQTLVHQLRTCLEAVESDGVDL